MLRKSTAGTITSVTFSIPVPLKAETITVVGDFNGWSHTATPLRKNLDGWSITMELPTGKQYEYRYLADGETWLNDWAADLYLPNELGGDNSVVRT